MVIDAPTPDEAIFKDNPLLHFTYMKSQAMFKEAVIYAYVRKGERSIYTKEKEAEVTEKFKQPGWNKIGEQVADLQVLGQQNLRAFEQGGWAVLEKHNRDKLDSGQFAHLGKEAIEQLKKDYAEAEKQAKQTYADMAAKAGNDANKLDDARIEAERIRRKAIVKINDALMPPEVMKERLATLRGGKMGDAPNDAYPTKREEVELAKYRLSLHPPQFSVDYMLEYTASEVSADFSGRTREAALTFRQDGKEKTLADMQRDHPEALAYAGRWQTAEATKPYFKQDGRDVTTGSFAGSFAAVVPEHIKREQLRGEFIKAVKDSKEYTGLGSEQEKADYLSVRLMETYKLAGNHNSWLAISGYGTSATIQQALDKQLEANRKDKGQGAAPQDPAMQKALADYRNGVNPALPASDAGLVANTPALAGDKSHAI